MSFWDSSAVVPLLVSHPSSAVLADRHAGDSEPIVWWGTFVECASALARLEREHALGRLETERAFDRLHTLRETWNEVAPVEDLRSIAVRFLRVHTLRAADAFQLAAAFLASEGRPASLEFVCFDERLIDAARREGFRVVQPEATTVP